MTKPPPSPSQQARSERMRVAAIEGAKARADVEARDVAVRKNMERLRALRLAKVETGISDGIRTAIVAGDLTAGEVVVTGLRGR